MAFYSVYSPSNFAVIPEIRAFPAAIDHLKQLPNLVDFGTAAGTQLKTSQLLAGSLYFAPAANQTFTLPSGYDMMNAFGVGLASSLEYDQVGTAHSRYVGSGAILRMEVVVYGAGDVTLASATGGAGSKVFESVGAGTGACGCLNIKFTSATGSYIVF